MVSREELPALLDEEEGSEVDFPPDSPPLQEKGKITSDDWRLLDTHMEYLQNQYGPFEIEAFCDPEGHNRHTGFSDFWSEEQDALQMVWAGRGVYFNPPFRPPLQGVKGTLGGADWGVWGLPKDSPSDS